MNEIFASTTLQDALFLSKKIMEKISQMDLVCVWVTFLVELASFNNKTVSMVAETAPENPTRRTFKIIKKNADGLSYAISIAQKYRLTYDHLIKRIRS
jgi:DNA mismatch repair ATPase MutS